MSVSNSSNDPVRNLTIDDILAATALLPTGPVLVGVVCQPRFHEFLRAESQRAVTQLQVSEPVFGYGVPFYVDQRMEEPWKAFFDDAELRAFLKRHTPVEKEGGR